MTTQFTKYSTEVLEKIADSLAADWAGTFAVMLNSDDAEKITALDEQLFKMMEIIEEIEDIIQYRYFHA